MDASPDNHFKIQESVYETKEFIEQGETIIYEATFQFNGVIGALDILVKKAYCIFSNNNLGKTILYSLFSFLLYQ